MTTLSYSMADIEFARTASVGIHNIAHGLLCELASRPEIGRMTVFCNSSQGAELGLLSRVELRCYDRPKRSWPARIVWDQWRVCDAARRAGNEWLFLPKGHVSFVRRCPVKLAVYIHDIIPLIYKDRHPSTPGRLRQAYFEKVYAATLRQSKLVFTNTYFTKGEIERWAQAREIACPTIAVAGCGFDIAMRRGLRKDQILVFIRPDPHKRADLAVKYVSRWMQETRFSGRVMCVGEVPAGLELPRSSQCAMLGRVRPEELDDLMTTSRVVVHFSEYEGFGMPPVEAALAGAVPVYSDVPATREAMNGAGCSFENASYRSFADAMATALETSPETALAWSDALRLRHSWRKVGDRILAGLQSV
jgi:glycosyltransferase involved in cell wall biosynthesis